MEIIKMPPVFTSGNPEKNIREMQRYLWQFVEQMQIAIGESRKIEKELQQYQKEEKQKAKDTPAAAFGRIKDLIIKSADIVEAYRTEITRTLEGEFVAVSAFGTFQERTTAAITETDKNVTQNFKAIQKIETDVAGLESGIRQMNAYIRTGFLYEDSDGISRYGVEIGEQAEKDGVNVFLKFARLSSDRLSFFDQNGIEVAYISDKKLYITSAQVQEIEAKRAYVGDLSIGGYFFKVGLDGHLTIS